METPLLEEIKNETLSDLEIKQEEINFELIIKEERFEIDEQVDNVSNNDTECNVELSKEKTEESDSIEFLQVKDEVVDSEWTEYDEPESDPLALAEFDSENKSDSMKDESSNEPNTSQDILLPANLPLQVVYDDTTLSSNKAIPYNTETVKEDENRTRSEILQLICPACKIGFSEAKSLQRHNLQKHSEDNPFKCEECNFTCSVPSVLLSHKTTHLQNKPYKCSQCSYSTKTWFNLKVHISRHAGTATLKCRKCNFSTLSASALGTHTRLNHPNEVQHRSSIGGFSHKMTHRMDVHFKCSQCSYSTTSYLNLKVHVGRHSGSSTLKCPDCDFTTISGKSLSTHARLNHPKEARRYSCSIGDFSHKMMYQKGKPLKCPQCSYSTTSSYNLKLHIGRHAENPTIKCPDCDFTTISSTTLNTHIRLNHAKEDQYCCLIDEFSPKMTYQKDAPFKCSQCSYSTTVSLNLRVHVGRHTQNTTLHCPDCDFSTISATVLSTHIRIIHSKENP